MRKLFGRVGSKAPIAEHIIKLFPQHDLYIEAFVGGGAIYFSKNPSKKEVINDLDKELMSGYRLIKQVSSDITKYEDLDTFDKQHAFFHRKPKTKEDKLTLSLLKANNTFGGTGKGDVRADKPSNPYNKLKNIQEYKDRVKNTTILSQDYKAVIRKYDNSNTFFYLDPPYEKSDNLYKHDGMNYEEMATLLKGLKGKFILSINDSPNIRKIFKGFKMKQIIVEGSGNKGVGKHDRKELIIMNY